MPTLKIDGMTVEVPAGTVVIEAAKKLGRSIPYYCYHEKLSIPANCRQCLVEVVKAPKLLPACYTQVADGMEVFTDTPRVKEAQRRNLEFILLNHPVDCPICDQAGECKLQDYYQAYDFKPSRLNVLPVHKQKVIRLGAQVVLDAERCILCTRCVRFFEEIVGERPLGVFKRGDRSELGLYPGQELPFGYARNVVDICPVGALTSEDFRFRKRVWFLTKTPGICTGCARGCNVTVEHHEGDVYRYRPRQNEAVNQVWICDDGAYSYKAQRERRILRPQVRKNGVLGDAKWDEALAAAAALLRAEDGGRPVGIALSAQASCEANFAFVRLGREALGGDVRFYVVGKPAWAADEILKVADQNPNTHGATILAGGSAGTQQDLLADVLAGKLRAVLLVGADLPDPEASALRAPALPSEASALRAPALPSLAQALAGVERLVVLAVNEAPVLEAAQVVLAAAHPSEEEGHFVNFQGRVQRQQRGPEARGRSGPEWKIALRLAAKLGTTFAWSGARSLFEEICASVAAFRGLTYDAVGPLGAPLPPSAAAAAAETRTGA